MLKTGTKVKNYIQFQKISMVFAYFLKLYIILYLRASFQYFSNILTSFRRGDFILTRKRITEILTQIRQSFCKRRSKSCIEKLSGFTFAAGFGYEKNSLFGTFYFRNQLICAVSKRNKQKVQKQAMFHLRHRFRFFYFYLFFLFSFSRYSSFCIFSHPMIYQIGGVMMSSIT